jgi:chaperonin cofactor prefoldin
MNDDVLVMAINGLEATVTEMKKHYPTMSEETYMTYNETRGELVAETPRYPTISDLLKRIESLENQYQVLTARHNLVAKRLAKVEGYPQEYEKTIDG